MHLGTKHIAVTNETKHILITCIGRVFVHRLHGAVNCVAGLSKGSGAWNWILQIDAELSNRTLTTQLVQRADTLGTDTEWLYNITNVTMTGLQLGM